MAAPVIAPLAESEEGLQVIDAQTANEQQQGIEQEHPLNASQPIGGRTEWLLRQGGREPEQRQKSAKGKADIAEPVKPEPKASPMIKPSLNTGGDQQAMQGAPTQPKNNQQEH